MRDRLPATTLAVAAVALVVGLAAPAAAHETTHLISGASIKANSVTGKQVKESSLGPVPRAVSARRLGGKPASAFASAAAASASGLAKIPTGGASHVVFARYPLTWHATCTVSGTTATFTISVTAAEDVNFTQGGSTDLGTVIAAGHTLEIDNGAVGGPLNTVTFYSVTGADGTAYSGLFTGQLHLDGTPCGTSVTASG
jgi:hypothetical protein